MVGFYIGNENDKARKGTKAYIGIDDKARTITKGYVGDENGKARLCWVSFKPDPVFENNTWEEIALACRLKVVPDTWSVGDQKTMTIGGWDYTIDIIGMNHDVYADDSGRALLTFQMHDLYGDIFGMNSSATNEGGWTECDMRKIHLPSIMQLMPKEVQEGIKAVKKTTSSVGTNRYGIITYDKLFLLSETEITNKSDVSGYVDGEGTQYRYYRDGASLRKFLDGIRKAWWTRSPHTASSNSFGYVVNDYVSGTTASVPYGVSFAFCF